MAGIKPEPNLDPLHLQNDEENRKREDPLSKAGDFFKVNVSDVKVESPELTYDCSTFNNKSEEDGVPIELPEIKFAVQEQLFGMNAIKKEQIADIIKHEDGRIERSAQNYLEDGDQTAVTNICVNSAQDNSKVFKTENYIDGTNEKDGFTSDSSMQNGPQCHVCAKFLSATHFLKTYRCICSEKFFKCDICDRTITKSYLFRQHYLSHSRIKDKSFKCEICSKTFASNCKLRIHIFTHTGQKPFKCDICDKTFSYNCYLRHHISTHTGQKSFKCDICNKSFSYNCRLRRHISTHTGRKRFKCNICNINFLCSSSLSQHVLIHSSDMSFK